jgi:hypothetical protein
MHVYGIRCQWMLGCIQVTDTNIHIQNLRTSVFIFRIQNPNYSGIHVYCCIQATETCDGRQKIGHGLRTDLHSNGERAVLEAQVG